MTYQKLLAQFVRLMLITLLLGSCGPIQGSPATPTLVNSPVPPSDWELVVTDVEYVDKGKIGVVIYNEPKSVTLNELIGCFSQQPENAQMINCSFGVYMGADLVVEDDLLLVQVTLGNTAGSIKTFDIRDVTILESREGGEEIFALAVGGSSGPMLMPFGTDERAGKFDVEPGELNIRFLFPAPDNMSDTSIKLMDLPPKELPEAQSALALGTTTPIPEPTSSPLEKLYDIPEGWQLIQAEPDNKNAQWTPALNGFRFALPIEWTCHEEPDDTLTTYTCILDESPDRFENQRKTKLRVTAFLWSGATVLSDLVPDYEEGQQFFGYTCETKYLTIDGLEAASIACTNPDYDDQIDYDTDRDAFGEATRQIPNFFILILNGDRVDQLHFETWDKSQMPSLFEEIIPYIHYDVDD